jgi:hypothetical protein
VRLSDDSEWCTGSLLTGDKGFTAQWSPFPQAFFVFWRACPHASTPP